MCAHTGSLHREGSLLCASAAAPSRAHLRGSLAVDGVAAQVAQVASQALVGVRQGLGVVQEVLRLVQHLAEGEARERESGKREREGESQGERERRKNESQGERVCV